MSRINLHRSTNNVAILKAHIMKTGDSRLQVQCSL